MPAIMPSKLSVISRGSAADPKRAIMDALGGAHHEIDLPPSWVLVATYIRPEKTAGGIILTNSSQSEDLWQGSLGLVLKCGPNAFADDDVHKFYGWSAKEGDWVLFRFSSSWEQHLKGVSVRWVPDSEIKGKISNPALIASS